MAPTPALWDFAVAPDKTNALLHSVHSLFSLPRLLSRYSRRIERERERRKRRTEKRPPNALLSPPYSSSSSVAAALLLLLLHFAARMNQSSAASPPPNNTQQVRRRARGRVGGIKTQLGRDVVLFEKVVMRSAAEYIISRPPLRGE